MPTKGITFQGNPLVNFQLKGSYEILNAEKFKKLVVNKSTDIFENFPCFSNENPRRKKIPQLELTQFFFIKSIENETYKFQDN